jgi:hypothetical protein
MTARYWFRPKRFGYGATPITWEGWLVTFVSALLIVAAGYLMVTGHGPQGAAAIVVIMIATIVISKAKTEGGWKWRWGDRQ